MNKGKKAASEIDKIIAKRIHELRLALGMSQMQLAKKINVTFQQAQKYERGTNRISAGRLYDIATALNKPVSYFYDNIEGGQAELPAQHRRMCMEVSRNFLRIKSYKHQEIVSQLARSLAEEEA